MIQWVMPFVATHTVKGMIWNREGHWKRVDEKGMYGPRGTWRASCGFTCDCCKARDRRKYQLGCQICVVVWEVRQANKELYKEARYDEWAEGGKRRDEEARRWGKATKWAGEQGWTGPCCTCGRITSRRCGMRNEVFTKCICRVCVRCVEWMPGLEEGEWEDGCKCCKQEIEEERVQVIERRRERELKRGKSEAREKGKEEREIEMGEGEKENRGRGKGKGIGKRERRALGGGLRRKGELDPAPVITGRRSGTPGRVPPERARESISKKGKGGKKERGGKKRQEEDGYKVWKKKEVEEEWEGRAGMGKRRGKRGKGGKEKGEESEGEEEVSRSVDEEANQKNMGN